MRHEPHRWGAFVLLKYFRRTVSWRVITTEMDVFNPEVNNPCCWERKENLNALDSLYLALPGTVLLSEIMSVIARGSCGICNRPECLFHRQWDFGPLPKDIGSERVQRRDFVFLFFPSTRSHSQISHWKIEKHDYAGSSVACSSKSLNFWWSLPGIRNSYFTPCWVFSGVLHQGLLSVFLITLLYQITEDFV